MNYIPFMKKKRKAGITGAILAASVNRIREDIGIVILAVGMVLIITLAGMGELRNMSENQRQKEYYYLYVANILKHNIACSDTIISQAKSGMAALSVFEAQNPGADAEALTLGPQDTPETIRNTCFYFELVKGIIKDRDFIGLTLMNNLDYFYNNMVSYEASLQKIEDNINSINSIINSRSGAELSPLKAGFGSLLNNILDVKQKESALIENLGRLGVSMKGGVTAASGILLNIIRWVLGVIFLLLVIVMAGVIVIFFKDLLNPKINRPGVL
jgi:hypothetical protein